MKVCLELVSPQGCTSAEYNIIVKPDCKCSGEKIRENLPKALYGNDIKINFIVKCCDEVLEAPSVPCDNLFALSQPILVKDSNPCNCPQNDDDCCYCDFDNCNYDCSYGLNEDFTSMCCCSCSKEKHYAIIIRSFSPIISQILSNYPQMYITDCSKTVKLTFIFDKNGSVSPCLPCCNDCCCGCGGCGGCGGGFGNGFGCCGGWFWIILLLCFC